MHLSARFAGSAFAVESARVENKIISTKLVIDIETNGVIEPGARYVLLRVPWLISCRFFDLKGTAVEVEEPPRAPQIDPILLRPVDDLS